MDKVDNKELMTDIFNWDNITFDTVAKYFAALTTLLIAFEKIRRQFSNFRLRTIIKSDVEILRTCKDAGLNTEQIQTKIDSNLEKLYGKSGSVFFSSLIDTLIGLIICIGFGLWTIKIYSDNAGFSPWIILTVFMSVSGLTMIFKEKKRTSIVRTNPVFTFNIYSWRDLIKGVSFLILFLVLTIAIYLTYGFSAWLILTVALTLAGISLIIKEIEIKIGEK
jgi:hypothetical protein